mmetsp:Transcript_27163/g.38209  ORF Transcript_27163/g.38209 Transcript_27163/m.38209 type:complete len:170 (+) Transcript_27163:314-823(+)
MASLLQRSATMARCRSAVLTGTVKRTTTRAPSGMMSYCLPSTTDVRFFSSPSSSSLEEDISKMSTEELRDNSMIPGWDLIHSPPTDIPKGALLGTVVSDKMDKTINVAVDRYKIVPKYRKRVKYTRKFMAHDENEVASMGDMVMIVPCHRITKNKHFMLREIIRAKGQL